MSICDKYPKGVVCRTPACDRLRFNGTNGNGYQPTPQTNDEEKPEPQKER